MLPVAALLDVGMKVLDKFIPDPEAKAKAQAELLRKQAEWRREQIRRNVENNLLVTAATVVVAVYLGALMWAISLHRENQLPLPWGS